MSSTPRGDASTSRCAARPRCDEPGALAKALGTTDRKTIKGLMWGKCQEPRRRVNQADECDALAQHSSLKSARAWRLKMALREVCARAAASNDPHLARADLIAWLSWHPFAPAMAK